MRKYQVMIVFNPEAKVADAVKEIKEYVTSCGATIEQELDLAMKRLSYEISGHNEGSFYEIILSGPADLTAKLAESLRINDQVIRFLIKLHSDAATKLDPASEVKSK